MQQVTRPVASSNEERHDSIVVFPLNFTPKLLIKSSWRIRFKNCQLSIAAVIIIVSPLLNEVLLMLTSENWGWSASLAVLT